MIPVYVINLRRSADRRVFMLNELARAGVEARFLGAADGSRFQSRCKSSASALSKAEFALVASHRMAWRRLLSSTADHAVVLEDDVYLGEGFRKFLDLDFTQTPFHALKLETWNSLVWVSRKSQPICGRQLHLLGYEHFGAAAYIISREGAGKLLTKTKPIIEPVDVTLFGGPSVSKRELTILQLIPAIAIQECNRGELAFGPKLASTLHDGRLKMKIAARARKPRGYARVRREVMRIWGQLSRWVMLSPTMRRRVIDWK